MEYKLKLKLVLQPLFSAEDYKEEAKVEKMARRAKNRVFIPYNLLLSFLPLFALFAPPVTKDEVKNTPPQISSVFPQGARSGSQLEVTINGQNLSRVTKIIFSEPGVSSSLLKTTNNKVSVKLDVAHDASVGPHYSRLITPRGSSKLLIFRVGELTETEEAEPNDTFDKANWIRAPLTVNARMAVDEDIDMYRIKVGAGERLIFDLLAARNGSGGDLALTLIDARGHIVKHSEDHFLCDPFLSFTFNEAGEYFLAIMQIGRASCTV